MPLLRLLLALALVVGALAAHPALAAGGGDRLPHAATLKPGAFTLEYGSRGNTTRLRLRCRAANWAAVAFGESTLSASDMFVARRVQDGCCVAVDVARYTSDGSEHARPVRIAGDVDAQGEHAGGEFRVDITFVRSFDASAVVWAYNDDAGASRSEDWFRQHEPGNYGSAGRLDFAPPTSASASPSTSTTSAPAPTSQYIAELAPAVYSMSWSIRDRGADSESIDIRLACKGRGWMAIALGESIADAEYMVAHVLANDTVVLSQGVSDSGLQNNMLPALWSSGAQRVTDGADIVVLVDSEYADGTMTAVIRRPTHPQDPTRKQITDETPILWSYNGNTESGDAWLSSSPEAKGTITINAFTGAVTSASAAAATAAEKPVPQFAITHGVGMLFTWLLVLPLGIFYARYLKSTRYALRIHTAIMCVAAVLVISFACVVFASKQVRPVAHAVIGITLLVLVAFQLALGLASFGGLHPESAGSVLDKKRPGIKAAHHWIGRIIGVLAFINMPLGIGTLYPIGAAPLAGMWVAYFTMLVLWVVAFVAAELYYRRRAHVAKPVKVIDKVDTEASRDLSGLVPLDGADTPYTWDELEFKIAHEGKQWVISGGYIFDMGPWMQHHPGGQVVLNACLGTDIFNDYFRVSEYDEDMFIPKAMSTARLSILRRDVAPFIGSNLTTTAESSPANTIVADAVHEHTLARLTQSDWAMIKRARRTHFHTRLARKKLATLQVGRVLNVVNGVARDIADHNPLEYRRSAMTAKITQSKGVAKIKLCLLHPHDLRRGEPTQFVPGQSVEIQARLRKRIVSRFYTPIGGNMIAFDMYVKTVPGGAMTPWLAKQTAGQFQIKVRGPFGTPLLNPDRADGSFDTTLFFAAGSGITPFLQLVQWFFLPLDTPMVVFADFEAQAIDELNALRGDMVRVSEYFPNDGWAFATNVSTGESGCIPVTYLDNRLQTAAARLVALHSVSSLAATVGDDILAPALLANPDQLEVHYFAEHDDAHAVVAGAQVSYQRLDKACIVDAVQRNWDFDEDSPLAQRIYVCGPPEYNRMVLEVLTGTLAVPEELVTVLHHASYS